MIHAPYYLTRNNDTIYMESADDSSTLRNSVSIHPNIVSIYANVDILIF